ncbi:NADH dehydrogenase [ubiquinone] 1 beta subcomplex subunit 7 [Leptopilina boulardi]|uniref:NADH dehydrogenase [ubiquinone] 1 beta subcomplex subunit 7 n=1 Tax=Leptopilina boulardi TaxID=63433 RepID=UPI0021F5787F|nr:NADH dehydrogenase [ubiquinone] 1 beta subcomplex subunit 7 [Leptopilina boulardi]
MGTNWTKTYFTHQDTMPVALSEPTFDPQMGFPNGRKERVMVATIQEMRANNVPSEFRDYCAHHYLKLEACRAREMPWIVKCTEVKDEYQQCLVDDWVLRMKEYERERRLLERKKRRATQEAIAA